jgi:hypothetical protein
MKGLAIVYAPQTGTAGGALLVDSAEGFPSSVNAMFMRLKQELGAPSGSSSRPAPSASASASAASPAPPQPLQPTVFPDGTGIIRLPAGWQVHPAHMGDVSASGPHGEGCASAGRFR